MSEVGKAAKRMGVTHPRDLRRTMSSERATPARVKRAKVEKRFGFSYEIRWFSHLKWKLREQWFKTSKARDQAMKHQAKASASHDWIRNVQIIAEDAPVPASDEEILLSSETHGA
jgi:hypothetical protein